MPAHWLGVKSLNTRICPLQGQEHGHDMESTHAEVKVIPVVQGTSGKVQTRHSQRCHTVGSSRSMSSPAEELPFQDFGKSQL